jgi:hypothetical protein
MNLKKLAILLVVLLGGMAIYYNMSTSDNTTGASGTTGTAGTITQTK